MDIYAVLASKPHNPHYLNKYITFIMQCQLKNDGYDGYTEGHHICPKAKDMFPEHADLKACDWNKALLTPRQHYIAHIMLWKIFPGIKSTSQALWFMSTGKWKDYAHNSRIYEYLKEEQKEKIKTYNSKRIENGEHHFQKDKNGYSLSKRRVDDGTHNWLGCSKEKREFQLRRVQDGTHNWLGSKNPVHSQIGNGTHHFLSSEYQSNLQRKRIENGTHHMLGGEIQGRTQRNLVDNGIHHFQKSVPCIDLTGKRIVISSELFYSQTGDKKDWEYVAFSSKEAKIRIKNAST